MNLILLCVLTRFHMSQEEQQAVWYRIDTCLMKEWIRTSTSQFGHPILIIQKKDGKLLMVVDYHSFFKKSLNAQTLLNHRPIPYIDNNLDFFYLVRYFSRLDLFSGYHQVRMEEGHQHKTAFFLWWGLYEYTFTPLGLTNASVIF